VDPDGLVEEQAKYVIVPVATIGCGKTTLALALSRLTGWGHVQNDEITSGGPKRFAQNIAGLLNADLPVVFADRNNHLSRMRDQLIKDLNNLVASENLRYICIDFLPSGPDESTWKLTRGRVKDRGDNHQSIRGYDDHKIDMIMKSFINQFQPVNASHEPDSLFDTIIEVDPSKGTRENLVEVLAKLREVYKLVPEYTEAEIDDAMEFALGYKPSVIKTFKLDLTYFCLNVPDECDLVSAIDKLFNANPAVDATFWQQLKALNRIQTSFHITLAHVRGKGDADKQRFRDLKAMYNNSSTKRETGGPKLSGLFVVPEYASDVSLISLAFDGKVMAIEVEVDNVKLRSTNVNAHVTIGTLEGVPPVAAGPMISSPFSVKVPWNIEPAKLVQLPFSAYFM
jgi:tRNA ligase